MDYDISNYVTLSGFECLNSCIYNHLQNAKCTVSKSDIFFVGEGCKVYYKILNGVPFISTNMYRSNFNFLKKVGIEYSYEKIKNKIYALNYLIECLKKQLHICLRVGTQHLVHHNVFKHVENTPHFIIPLLVDENKNLIYISDGYIPSHESFVFQGWTSLDAVLSAWEEQEYCYILFHSFKSIEKNLDLIRKKSEENFLIGVSDYLNIDNDSNSDIGWYAIYKLLLNLKLYLENNEYTNFSNMVEKINYQIKVNGFLTMKRYIYEFISDHKEFVFFKNEYDTVLKKWNHIDKYLLKVGITKQSEHMDSLLYKTYNLCENENRILKNIIGIN